MIKVLIVEDAIVAQLAVKSTLKLMGVEHIDIAGDGRQALEFCETHTYDLILMDIGLPDMPGDELAHQIRSLDTLDKNKTTPIIAVTAHADEEREQALKSKGITDVTVKPFTQACAQAILDQWVTK